MTDLGDEIIDVDLDSLEADPRRDGGSSSPLPASAMQGLSIALQGFLLKKCRHGGDQKPWKKRWFTLRGSSLLYFPTREAAGALRPKLFAQLTPASTVTLAASGAIEHGMHIQCGPDHLWAAAATRAEAGKWLAALTAARAEPAALWAGEGVTVSQPSLGQRVKMSVAGAVASSALGQAMLTRYLDPAARDLLRELAAVAALRSDERRAAGLKRALLDVSARLLVIVSEARMPVDTNTDVLYEDTLNFTQSQDFLTYSRDQRLRELRGADAEVQEINMAALITPMARVAAIWRTVLEGSCKAAVLARFDDVFGFFVDPSLLTDLLLAPPLRPYLERIDRAMRRLLEVF